MVWSRNVEKILDAIGDMDYREGIERTVDKYEEDIENILKEYPETLRLAEYVRNIRRLSTQRNEELRRQFRDRCDKLGVDLYIARDVASAVKHITSIIDGDSVVVKSKSMVSEELGIREVLEKTGCEVWETDLGEFIIQLARDEPMHIVTPAIHFKKERVAELFSQFFKKRFTPEDVEKMVRTVSDFLRNKYFEARYGIIGSNFISVEEPASILIHNEGNITMTWNTPKRLIILADILKLVPSLEDAIKAALVTSRYAGYRVAGYYDVLPYKSLLNRGVELHVVLLDGGRSKIIGDEELWIAGTCIKCGACMYVCSVYQIVGGRFGGKAYPGGIGTIITSFTMGLEGSAPSLYTCLLDMRCREICPMDIDIPEYIRILRARYVSRK